MQIRKWYADCVSTDGSVFIAYAAQIGVGPFTLPYQAVLTGYRGAPVSQRTTLSGRGMPTPAERRVTWRCAALDLDGSWSRLAPPVHRVLLDTPAVTVDWRCHMPAAEAAVRVGARSFEGAGYLEELIVRGSPAAIPIRRLRWGRFLGENDSVVWIEWRGPQPLTLVVHNGVQAEGGTVSHEGVSFDGFRLILDRGRRWTLRDERVEASVFPDQAWLRPLVPRALARVREVKWAAPGSLRRWDGAASGGWAIYEEVVWP